MRRMLITVVGCLVIVQFVATVAVLVYAKAPHTTEERVERCNDMTEQTKHQIESCTRVIDHYLRSKE